MSYKPNPVPWSVEAEQSVLGALLLDNGAAWRVADLTAGQFYDARHGSIFDAIRGLVAARQPADVVTVFERLQALGKAQECGGLGYLNALAQSVPGAANLSRYAEIVADRAQRRELLAALDQAATLARDTSGQARDVLDKVTATFTGLRQCGQRAESHSLADLMAARVDHWQALQAGEAVTGTATKLPSLDKALGGGLRPGAHYVLAARPSVGKTSFAGQIALTCAGQGRPTLILSQEMRAADLADRVAANLGRVDLGALTTGAFEPDDWTRIAAAVEMGARLPVHIDDQPGLTLALINAKARRHQQRHGLGLLVVDYLQLCAGSDRRDNRNTQIEEISRGLKTLAKDLDVPVLSLAQLNRQSMQRDEPDLADLRDSGSIEQDADVVMLLHPKGTLPDGSMLIAGIVAKNRQGRRVRVALAFHGSTQRWTESTADVSRGGEVQRAGRS